MIDWDEPWPFHRLRRLAVGVMGSALWQPTKRVDVVRLGAGVADHMWGRTSVNAVWFPAVAPVAVVAHELAHVVTWRTDRVHGELWQVEQDRVRGIAASIVAGG